MTTLREFIAENTFNQDQIDAIRKSIADLASGRQVVGQRELPTLIEMAASDGLTRYYHHQEILRFIERYCPDRLDVEMSKEDVQQLGTIGATVFELKYFAQ